MIISLRRCRGITCDEEDAHAYHAHVAEVQEVGHGHGAFQTREIHHTRREKEISKLVEKDRNETQNE